MVKFELVFSSKFGIEVFCWCEFCQVWVESDLVPCDRVHGTTDDTKERVDPPSSVSEGSGKKFKQCGERAASRQIPVICDSVSGGIRSRAGARWEMKVEQRDGALMSHVECAGAG